MNIGGISGTSAQKRLLSSFLATLLFFNMVLPIGSVGIASSYAAGSDKSALLTNISSTVKQNGVEVDSQTGHLDSAQPVDVSLGFNIPVIGDELSTGESSTNIEKGDWALIPISSSFTITTPGSLLLKFGAVTVAHVSFIKDASTGMTSARVDFDGDDSVFDGTSSNVSCLFNASLQYDPSGAAGNPGDHVVSILNKTYTVVVPNVPITYGITKSGVVNLSEGTITWTSTVSAARGAATASLENAAFRDDLTNVGTYVAGSLSIGGQAATPEYAANVLKYTFPQGSVSPQVVTFKTKISDAKYYVNSVQSITNKAQVYSPTNVLEKEASTSVSFTPSWIVKSAVASDTAGGSSSYISNNRSVVWTIVANQMDKTLRNATITDVIPAGLTWESATLEYWNGTTWSAPVSVTPDASGKYALGDISAQVRLKIKTRVPDEVYNTTKITYSNTAKLTSTDVPPSGVNSNASTATFGINGITKSGTVNPQQQKIKWTVGVDVKNQSIPALKSYDLLVYGTTINLNTVTGIPSGITASSLTPSYNQKFIANSFTGSGLTYNVIPIFSGGNRVADLLEVTGFSTTASNSYTFETKVLNPSIVLGNKTSTVTNTASLYSNSTRIASAASNASYTSNIIEKSMIRRTSLSVPSSLVNSGKTNTKADGFNYEDKSVIYRIGVNASNFDFTSLVDSTEATLSPAIVTDSLPAGWVFDEITPGSNFLIFSGTGVGGAVTASSTTPTTVSGLTTNFVGNTATFTFDKLDQPYVILVKARPSSATLNTLFASNATTTATNKATLSTGLWGTGVSVTQDTTIVSTLLKKSLQSVETGLLRWTVEYNPYNLTGHGSTLKDVIPEGLEVRTNSSGTLLVGSDNVTISQMSLNTDGSLTKVSDITPVVGQNVEYDPLTRVLTFKIPDSSKAYQFTYLTDVTGNPGTVSNSVSLLGAAGSEANSSSSYAITQADGLATLTRSGYINVSKVSNLGVALPNAEFSLYSANTGSLVRKATTGAAGTLSMRALPSGSYILRETKAPTGYSLSTLSHRVEVAASSDGVSVSVDGKTGADSHNLSVTDYPVGTTGTIVLSKTVVGDGADHTKPFEFTVTFSDNSTHSYQGQGVADGMISSGGKVSLADGQSIIIYGVAAGTLYSIAEKDYEPEYYSQTSTGSIGSVSADATSSASFVNRHLSDLTLSKVVTGKGAETDTDFDFVVSLDASGTFAYTGDKTGTISDGDTVSLKGGQSLTIKGLPTGTAYSIDEKPSAHYRSEAQNASGVIEGGVTHAIFTNTHKLADIDLSKAVTGRGAETDTSFDFAVSLDATGTFEYTGDMTGTVADGDTISLKGGQSVTIKDVPVGTEYGFVEQPSTHYLTSSQDATGTVALTGSSVRFTNTHKVAGLTLSKTVTGRGAETDTDFNFIVNLGEGGSFAYEGDKTGAIADGGTISLKGGQTVTIKDIPVGTSYSIIEEPSAHYISASQDATGTVGLSGSSVHFTNTRKLANLTLSKTVKGANADKTKSFKFVVSLDATGAFEYTGDKTGTVSDGGTVSLKGGQSIIIKDVPVGVAYSVVEEKTQGYKSEAKNGQGTVAESGNDIQFINTKVVSTQKSPSKSSDTEGSSSPRTGDSLALIIALLSLLGCGVIAATSYAFIRSSKNER